MAGITNQFSPAGQALNFGGSLADQIGPESEEEKRRRLQALASAQSRMGVGSDYGTALSPAGAALWLGRG